MKATVTKPFKDKFTGERYKPGQPYEGDPERIEYLRQAGYLNPDAPLPLPLPVEEPMETAETTLAETEEIEPVNAESTPGLTAIADLNAYQLMTKKELFRELTRRGIKFNEKQTKSELIGLL